MGPAKATMELMLVSSSSFKHSLFSTTPYSSSLRSSRALVINRCHPPKPRKSGKDVVIRGNVQYQEKLEVLKSMEGWGAGGGDPDEYYVCLVGNMVTEEALPMYQSMANRFDGANDETGASATSWAQWNRGWSAEENRHGDVLTRYLYLSGRLDMRQVERTIQHLIGSGMERATFVSHGNTARHAKERGDATLARICGLIAADERRHETAYTRIVAKLFELDPDNAVRAFAGMMRESVTMPGLLMFDGPRPRPLRALLCGGAAARGVHDRGLCGHRRVLREEVAGGGVGPGLTGEGRRAQDYVCGLPQRIRKMVERAQERSARESRLLPFSWIFNREVLVKSGKDVVIRGSVQYQEKLEVLKSMEGWVEDNILTLLKPVESSWQPQDFLPDSSSSSAEEFFDAVRELRERAAGIPDEYYVCLVGNLVSEEALPTNQSMANRFDGANDETGASATSWAQWNRGWSAEENRHGDVLTRYLYLSGRLDMRQVERTIQHLIGSGMILHEAHDAYRGFVYTSFQERATFVSHGNTARHAKERGDITLARLCGLIAADERRHETAYTRIVEKLFELDPDNAMRAFAGMMRERATMPGLLMFDGRDRDLFRHYSAVAQRLGVYTTGDYADIVEYFVKRWRWRMWGRG
uniref:Acyl-[acyl-carrier-protein] desaturase n=1 Tax=Ananas comosus var. bracteatus TaxID=296719 RepID=A0A6V7Q075_ANACO|nr:unnamed protein product [Ananas comosus var. bracteatus]